MRPRSSVVMTVQQFAEFNNYHARNRAQAEQLRRFVVLLTGVGATGSHVAALLAHAGCSLVLFDRDVLDYANLTRHYVTDRGAIGQPKAHALARKLRAEVPSLQSIRGVKGDIEAMSDAEIASLLQGASLVIGSSGRDAVDHRLNRAARDRGIPLVIPSLWADNQTQVLGDVHVVAWHLPQRRGACFECLRQATTDAPAPAEAQPGVDAEVVRVASLTTEVVLALLLSESPQFTALMRNLNRGACYFLIPRWPPSMRSVITSPRVDCAACSTTTSVIQGEVADRLPGPLRDWLIGGALASAVLWHQLVPGLDVMSTIVFIGLAGLWWRGRLPSYSDVSLRVRRWWNGR